MTDTHDSAEAMHDFFASCPEMLFIAEADGRMLHWSDSLGNACGASMTAGKPLEALLHPEDQAAFSAAWDRVRRATDSVRLNVRLADAQANYRLLSLNARRSSDGKRVHGSLRDATPAGARAPSLKERLLDALTSHLNIAIYAVNNEGIFLLHEGKGLVAAGMEPGNLVGKCAYDIFPEEDTKELRSAFNGISGHNFITSFGVDWETWSIPVRNERGSADVALGISLDITEAKRTENELRERLTQINKQQEVIRNLSTPIIEVWNGVLTLPMVGVVDSVRTADVMDSLLERIVEKQARFAILDLTGVDMVDTQVASHLIALVTAIRLLGAEGIIAGIKGTVAQTMISLGLDLSEIVTHGNLRMALQHCIQRMNKADSVALASANHATS